MSKRARPRNVQSVYLPETILAELEAEAKRLDRPLSWLVQRAWSSARDEIRRIPSMPTEGS